ncbi:AraC-like DNA-binding protein/mannose-6-phosphate isomerase-like protein (cupin superfamily) [Clostridium tetanomorphum]|uniref:AraC family transcriptional regulator n=2 Tax=Clostridium tetanomorphum TaxID=1553 RepID=A0A923EBG7_CLOTT|nr:AraC family transcriptional regulator [Clostridium tetanomorphum]KAJ49074.1 AraC family transcriptional regulator [Clostridium tetanomorphum DSM 665]KAJ53767.1 AraC family transcriptional regulator [Clostridium tetanomorphum DSM 665]MBC2397278.1 AraC family transcriptional regulator [Clostridium tetanomorphum]MBP1862497.1 AraC-like DNA-binding protein/mannose-6-phosphate isomerase-like protein (cupin superfamily) [Clostridium tetanomorphum]NRS85662.1 AraC-like DNA-binding protein/mannose-6-
MKNLQTYYNKKMPDPNFGIDIFLAENFKKGRKFNTHWHENMQLYFFTEGKALVECNKKRYYVTTDSIVVINNNELHSLESLSDDLKFYIIRIDSSFVFSNQVDLCQTKFLSPLSQNQISFQNLIENDKQILDCVTITIQEYFSKKIGYELAVKSFVYQLIVLLLRKYISKFLTRKELISKVNNLKRFDLIFKYIDSNYSKKICIEDLSNIVHISTYHFCRIFKEMTGKTTTDYINGIRLEKAVDYLNKGDMNITEIALRCGFDSINYFSRLFKRHYNVSPTKFRETL